MNEIRISIRIDLVESYDQQRMRQEVTVNIEPAGSEIDYALQDHAFRKMDQALEDAKLSVRKNAKAAVKKLTGTEEAPL